MACVLYPTETCSRGISVAPAEQLNFASEELNFASEELNYPYTFRSRSEEFEFDGEIFFGVLAEVVEEFDGLGGELVDVGVELVVGEEFAGGAFAALDAGDDVVDAFGGGVEAGDGGAGVEIGRASWRGRG